MSADPTAEFQAWLDAALTNRARVLHTPRTDGPSTPEDDFAAFLARQINGSNDDQQQ